MNQPRFLTLAAALMLPALSQAAPNRGLWMWGSTTLPGGSPSSHGSSDVVGDVLEENIAVSFMTSYGVKRVFGSYGTRPADVVEKPKIAAWNAKLDAAGIDSQLLLEEAEVNNPAKIASLLNKVTTRLINFNNSVAPESKFDALHLDLEPQQLALWKDDVVGTDKRALLTHLANAYDAIRTHLDTNGFTSMPVYADINFSWDKLPIDGGSVAWADAADRNAWYADIGADLDGLTIMTFSKDNAIALADATDFERSGIFPGPVVVGIQPRTGVGELWPNHTTFYNVMTQLETNLGTTEATDIENYAFWRHAVATFIPALPAAPEIFLPATGGGGTGGVIVIHAKPGFKYVLKENNNLSQPNRWSEVETFTTSFPDRIERFEHPIPIDGVRNFWIVDRSPIE